jgi:hypothetical protein
MLSPISGYDAIFRTPEVWLAGLLDTQLNLFVQQPGNPV